MSNDIEKLYGNKVRVRICGLCWQNERLLMTNHKLGLKNFWAPPGGGLDFGQSIEETLKREFREETGLAIEVGRFRFIAEFIGLPLHAVEVFFEVRAIGGQIRVGIDPEMASDRQIIQEVNFLEWDLVSAIPADEKHGIFNLCTDLKDFKSMNGFFRI